MSADKGTVEGSFGVGKTTQPNLQDKNNKKKHPELIQRWFTNGQASDRRNKKKKRTKVSYFAMKVEREMFLTLERERLVPFTRYFGSCRDASAIVSIKIAYGVVSN